MARRASSGIWLIVACYGVLALAASILIIIGAQNVSIDWSHAILIAGLLGIIVTLSTLPVALLLHRMSASTPATTEPGGRVEALLEQIHDQSMLSENAKRVLFREREIALLRQTVEDDIQRGEFDAALILCDEMAEVFGQREEAETFRARIEQMRREHYEAQVETAMSSLEHQLDERDWSGAHLEAARIRRLFPDSHHLSTLNQRIETARLAHKDELKSSFLDAADHEDTARAMDCLRQLDVYLSREEGEALQERAQAVVAQFREEIGRRFETAVSEHRWADAAQVGDQIVRDFPNTKMAAQVKAMIDVIRTRATEAAMGKVES